MNPTRLHSCFVILSTFTAAEAIRCFNCHASTSDSLCETDYKGLRDTSAYYMYRHDANGTVSDKKVKQLNYDKDCDKEINETYCVIEQKEAFGKITSYIRDCSDGFTFSQAGLPLLDNVRPTNKSKCAEHVGAVFCVTLCDTDFCNGPARASVTVINIMTVIISSIVGLFYT